MQRMKPLTLVTLETVLSGVGTSVPIDMKPTTGILVWQDQGNLAVWCGNEWVPMNSAGYTHRFGVNMPVLAVGSWAIITSPKLAVVGGECFRRFTASELMFAFHMVAAEELVQNSPESFAKVPDLNSGASDRADVDSDVTAYIAEHAHDGATPLR